MALMYVLDLCFIVFFILNVFLVVLRRIMIFSYVFLPNLNNFSIQYVFGLLKSLSALNSLECLNRKTAFDLFIR